MSMQSNPTHCQKCSLTHSSAESCIAEHGVAVPESHRIAMLGAAAISNTRNAKHGETRQTSAKHGTAQQNQ